MPACDVVVDFTVAAAARDDACRGWRCTASTPSSARPGSATTTSTRSAPSSPRAGNCVIAANFAISAVLMMRFAEMAAPYFDTAEIIELHHDRKIDAPSGTAVATAERMAAAVVASGRPTRPTHEVVAGARGGVGPAGIRVHSVRMRGMVAHQEVILGAAGQTLTIRQDSYDRVSFMPGVLLACKRVADAPRPHRRPRRRCSTSDRRRPSRDGGLPTGWDASSPRNPQVARTVDPQARSFMIGACR